MTSGKPPRTPRFGAHATFGDQPDQPASFLRIGDIMERVKLSKSTIYAWMQLGKFPQQHKIWGTLSRWSEQEIDDWIAEQIAKKDDEAA